jgi:dihydrofolate reductase
LSRVIQEGQDYGYSEFIDTVDTVIPGRRTFDWGMKNVKEFPHSDKDTYVIKRTPRQKTDNIKFYTENLKELVLKLKQAEGKDIVIFGSPSIGHLLMTENLIDDYWLFIDPVLPGQGIPLFNGIKNRTYLKLISNNIFSSGVVCLHYQSVPEK